MEIRPITLRAARQFIAQHHRHNIPPKGWLYGVALWEGETLVGVGIASRPVSRVLDNGTTMEVTRTCTDGTKNANSQIYGALCRAAKALGYKRVVTYTLAEEPGVSLKAAGFTLDAELGERPSWDVAEKMRYQTDIFGEDRRPPGPKLRWMKEL